MDKDLSCSSLDGAQENELCFIELKHEAVVCVWYYVSGDERMFKLRIWKTLDSSLDFSVDTE